MDGIAVYKNRNKTTATSPSKHRTIGPAEKRIAEQQALLRIIYETQRSDDTRQRIMHTYNAYVHIVGDSRMFDLESASRYLST